MALRRSLGLIVNIERMTNVRRAKWYEFLGKIKSLGNLERFKGTFIERWGKYWKNVYQDYQEVAVDVAKQCRARPIRASFNALLLGGTYYMAKTNPDEESYRRQLLKNTIRVIPVGDSTRNPTAVKHIRLLEQLYNENVVRHLNLGIMSLIWIDDYDDACANYRATCTYLRPRYATFNERIIDVGFLHTWWLWEDKMRDYDVNEEEFVHLDKPL